MIIKMFDLKKAISVVLVGIAFFFFGCQPRVGVPVKIRPEESASDLRRTAESYQKTNRLQKALALFKKIAEEYPGDKELPFAEYQIAKIYYLLSEYEISSDHAFEWLGKHPMHPDRVNVMSLLGEDFEALGDKPQAFYWFLEAKKGRFNEPVRQKDLDEKLAYLIEVSDIEDIDRIAVYAAGTHYAPLVRQRRADIFLDRDELEKARAVAMNMVEDTHEPSWVLAGMQILKRIQEELSVKKGVVGCLLPLSGPFAIYGEEVLNGIQLGIFSDSAQDSGIELVIRDTEGKPAQAVAGLEDLAHNENVIAVIGPLSQKTASPVAERAQELGVPIITLTQKQGVTDERDMVFRNFLTPLREVRRLLDPTLIGMGIKRFGILYPDNSYGRFYMNLFWDRLDEIGGTVTAVECYDPDQTDFAKQIRKMTGVYYSKPLSMVEKMLEMRPPEEEESKIYPDQPEPFIDFDAVFIPDNYETVSMIAPQLTYYDVRGVLLMGTSLWQSPELIKIAKDYVQGAVFTSGFYEKSGETGVGNFVSRYRENFASTPGMLAAIGYDTIRLLQEIMQAEHIQTRRSVRNELYRIVDYKGVTGDILFDEQGELKTEPLLLTVSGRRMKVVRATNE